MKCHTFFFSKIGEDVAKLVVIGALRVNLQTDFSNGRSFSTSLNGVMVDPLALFNTSIHVQ